jgi:HPt (histidine-containing phosphotransfer) domain-containing protein
MSTDPILNPHAIQALRDLSPGGGSEFLCELITIYLEDTPKQLAQLEEALARQDLPLVIRSAHTIKGSSGNFGATQVAGTAQEIELAGKAGNLPAAAALLPALKTHFARVVEALKALAAGA